MLVHGMLRGFGANKVMEAKDSMSLLQSLSSGKIDILLLDARMPAPGTAEGESGGLAITRAIRRNAENENRTTPILLMTSDTREVTVKTARDAGVNMLVAKPMSPAALYDRLTWIAFTPRKFIDTETYFGPDRRFKIEGFPNGIGRRKGDKPIEIAEESGPALAQNDIDNLFTSARTGQS
jgi:CheY-like chemotaxis protein